MPIRLLVVLLSAIALVSCSHGDGSKPAATSTPIPEHTGIAAVDGAIDAELRRDANKLQRLLRFASVPCAEGSDGVGAPACRPGEKDGTPVDVLAIGDCHRSFQRPDEFREDGITTYGVRLYAVYAASPDLFPPGKYFAVFLRRPIAGGVPSESAFALSMSNDGITGYHDGCGQTAEQLVASEHLSVVISPPAPASSATATYAPTGDPVAFGVCADGHGWVRPSLDDQRRHLASLGEEFRQFASDPGLLYDGAYVGRDAENKIIWRYLVLWTFVSQSKDEQYALARSGLWSATPNTQSCDRSAGLTLLIDHEVTDMRFDGTTVSITSREVPGYFEYIEYKLPADIRSVGYRLLAEDGTWIGGCCD